jgi:hypothetical protein
MEKKTDSIKSSSPFTNHFVHIGKETKIQIQTDASNKKKIFLFFTIIL